jgi:hypothetical protein
MEQKTILTIEPEETNLSVVVCGDSVNLARLFDFQVGYRRFVDKHGVTRLGVFPEYTFTVRPGLVIVVRGYKVEEGGGPAKAYVVEGTPDSPIGTLVTKASIPAVNSLGGSDGWSQG